VWHVADIPVADAVLGAPVEVPSLDGELSPYVAPGTQPDTTLRLSG
jgi:DnaJ-class molecular chaperone